MIASPTGTLRSFGTLTLTDLSFGLKLPPLISGPRVDPIWPPLVALGAADPVRFRV